jgi:catechol 2,3-dioxygenase-like lactoylglutathione lyase family enzyme
MKVLAQLASVLLLVGAGGFVKNPPAAKAGLNAGAAPSLIRTHGVKINVDDMEKALSFYNGKLGFEVEDRGGYSDQVLLKSGGGAKLILNRVKKLRPLGPNDTRLSFTLQVNDLDAAVRRMKALGVEFAESEKRREAVGDAISIRDPFGRPISMMHQTVVKVEPFKEPRVYNFGFLVPDMGAGRDFYANRLGFVVRSEKYLPLDLPLGHRDATFAFMLHARPGVRPVKSAYPEAAPFLTMVFETADLARTLDELRRKQVNVVAVKDSRQGRVVLVEDPFGNVSEVVEARK